MRIQHCQNSLSEWNVNYGRECAQLSGEVRKAHTLGGCHQVIGTSVLGEQSPIHSV